MGFDKAASFLVRHRKIMAAGAVLACVGLSLFAFRIRFENSVESFVSPRDPNLLYYRETKKEFGDDQMIALAIPVGEVFTTASLEDIDRLSKALGRIPQVRKARSITTAQDIAGTEGGIEVKPFLEKIPKDPEALAVLRSAALANPLYQQDLVSLNGTIASFLIELKVSDDPDRYKEVFEEIQQTIADSPFRGKEYYIAGTPLIELQMTQDMWHDLRIFLPATYLCLFVLLWLCFRDFRSLLGILVTVSLEMGVLVGLIGLCGIRMNGVTAGLPSLILCISILETVHILSLYRAEFAGGAAPEEAMRISLRKNLNPCFWTTLTTTLGFLSVAASSLVPIKQFGFLAAATTAAAYPITFFVMPFFLGLIRPEDARAAEKDNRFLAAILRSFGPVYSNRPLMIFLIAATLAVSIAGAARIQTETMFLKFIRNDTLIKRSTDFIEKKLGGITVVEVIVETPQDDGVKEPKVLKEIEAFQDFIRTIPGVDKSVSPVQFVKEMHQAMNEEKPEFYLIPDSRNLIAQYILTYSFSGRDNDLDDFVDYTYRRARVRVRVSDQSSRKLQVIIGRMNGYIRSHFDPALKVKITSYAAIQASMMDSLVTGQMKGFGLEIALMFLIFWATNRRSWVVAGLGLVPNLVPIFASLGLMGFAGITMNTGTVMTCCIAFGLVVDDTIHLLEHARDALRAEADAKKAVEHLFVRLGPAVIYSSVLLVVGFAILLLGRSYFTVDFGLICAFTILAALVCDLLITPFFILHVPAFRNALKR